MTKTVQKLAAVLTLIIMLRVTKLQWIRLWHTSRLKLTQTITVPTMNATGKKYLVLNYLRTHNLFTSE